MTLFEAKDLTLGYEGRSVVENISFSAGTGDYLCIVGDNGAGKSTLVKALLGLIQPLSGSLVFHCPPGSIGYLPQAQPNDRIFPASAGEVALSGAVGRLGRRLGYSKEDKARARANLARMGVSDLAKRPFSDLSGGQRQRVLLARALTAADSVLLLDEPAAGLDIHTSAGLYALIDDLNREGLCIIMVTHDIHPALNSANKILHLGGEVFSGAKDDYFKSGAGRRYLEEAGHHD